MIEVVGLGKYVSIHTAVYTGNLILLQGEIQICDT